MSTTQDQQYTKTEERRNKLPSIQFYPGDWKRDPGIQSLGFFERGVWMEILFLMHESSERGVLLLNGKPMTEQALANCLGLDNQILTTTLTTLLDSGVASRRESDGALMNRRMVRDEKLRQTRTKAGSQGGNPALLKQKSTSQVNQIPTTGVNQIPTPSSSSSSSSSDLTTEVSTIVDTSSVTASQTKPEKISIAPKLSMTKEQAQGLVEEFGRESCEYYKKICSDYLLSKGKTMKDAAAFMRNWIRREIAERKGFYYPKQNGYRPHTAASMAEKNLEYIRKMEGKSDGSEDVAEMFGSLFDDKKELGSDTDGGRSLVPLVEGPKR